MRVWQSSVDVEGDEARVRGFEANVRCRASVNA